MSLSHNPSIVTDGLVFAYDMGNGKKSWKGATTTNLYTDGDFSSQALHPVRSGTWAIVADPRNNAKKVLKATPSGSNQYHGRDITVTVSSVYSLQMEVYVSPDFNGTNVQMYPEQGGSGANIAYNLSNKGTWQLLKFNGKSATTTNIRMLAYVLSAFTTGYVLISNVQVELSSFATPFINGTRSNTQAILDWTGNNTITANSLTYNADETFSFNGTSNYITLPSQNDAQAPLTGFGSFTGADTNAFSIEMWIKTSQISGSASYNAPCLVGRDNGDIYANLTIYNGYVYWAHYNSAWLDNLKSTTMVSDNNWHHVVYVNNIDETGSIYVDGNLEVTSSSSLSGTNYFSPDYIGRGYNLKYFSGSIGNVRFYDKSLSAAEVAQNFNALRGRYGI